jgi:hypothetical protein
VLARSSTGAAAAAAALCVLLAGGCAPPAGAPVLPADAEALPPPPRAAPGVFPLAVSRDGRHLVDREGRPWRIQADAAWMLSSNATGPELDAYLDARRAQGFNAFYLMALVHPGGYPSPYAPRNRAGDPPLAIPDRLDSAGASPDSERYWRWIDEIVDRAAARGMAVMLCYAYLGFDGGAEGWYQTLLAQPDRAACRRYGEWIGARYRDRPNVIWFALGDFTPPPGSEGEARARAVLDGIKASGAGQLFMAEPSGPAGIPTLDAKAFADAIDLSSFYGYGRIGRGECYVQADAAHRLSPPKPAWVQEGGYEFEDNTGGFTGQSYETRRTRFWSVLAGGTAGDGFGTRDVWLWRDVPGKLTTPGAEYASYAFALFASLPWWELRPSGAGPGRAGRELVVAGQGRWGGLDWIAAAVTARGSHLLAYVPPRVWGKKRFTREWLRALWPFDGGGGRELEVDLSLLRGPVRARWLDPATGRFLPIAGGHGLPPAGTRRFVTPAGRRADGSDDWLLVLDVDEGLKKPH